MFRYKTIAKNEMSMKCAWYQMQTYFKSMCIIGLSGLELKLEWKLHTLSLCVQLSLDEAISFDDINCYYCIFGVEIIFFLKFSITILVSSYCRNRS